MKPTPFDQEMHIPPIPFDERHLQLAAELKEAGLTWEPHVGCFVWDRDGCIEVPSPFPNSVYFVLNLGHFLRIFGSVEEMKEKVIWLPTWHQARLFCEHEDLDEQDVTKIASAIRSARVGDEVLALYEILLGRLKKAVRGR